MSMRFSIDSITLLIVFVFLAQDAEATPTEATPTGEYNFMKLGIRWAKSYCDSDQIRVRGQSCPRPIPQILVVHGFWPMYWVLNDTAIDVYGYDDMYVPPYNNSGCSDVTPAPEASIKRATLNSIWDDMVMYWPSILRPKAVLFNWKKMWARHGMCGKTPTKPLTYFETAINFAKAHDFLAILEEDRIIPDDDALYNIHAISRSITKSVRVKPQIRCTTTGDGKVVQFSELLFCFDRDGLRMRCNADFYECPGIDETKPNENYLVKFPQWNT